MLFLELALAPTHLVIVIDVAALALALGVDCALAGMAALCRQSAATVLMIAMIAHAHSVKGQISVRTGRNYTLFASGTSITSRWQLDLAIVQG